MATFGPLLSYLQDELWEFNSKNQLIGVHGSVTEGKISSLGFITLDPENACPSTEPKEELADKSDAENKENDGSE